MTFRSPNEILLGSLRGEDPGEKLALVHLVAHIDPVVDRAPGVVALPFLLIVAGVQVAVESAGRRHAVRLGGNRYSSHGRIQRYRRVVTFVTTLDIAAAIRVCKAKKSDCERRTMLCRRARCVRLERSVRLGCWRSRRLRVRDQNSTKQTNFRLDQARCRFSKPRSSIHNRSAVSRERYVGSRRKCREKRYTPGCRCRYRFQRCSP